MHNKEIREAAKKMGIHLWQVAEAYGVNDGNFSRKLRKELPAPEKEKIMGIIDRLAQENQGVIGCPMYCLFESVPSVPKQRAFLFRNTLCAVG